LDSFVLRPTSLPSRTFYSSFVRCLHFASIFVPHRQATEMTNELGQTIGVIPVICRVGSSRYKLDTTVKALRPCGSVGCSGRHLEGSWELCPWHVARATWRATSHCAFFTWLFSSFRMPNTSQSQLGSYVRMSVGKTSSAQKECRCINEYPTRFLFRHGRFSSAASPSL